MSEEKTISAAEWQTCIKVISQVIADADAALDLPQLERLATLLYKKARKERRKEAAYELSAEERAQRLAQSKEDRRENRETDRATIGSTGMAQVHQGKELTEAQLKNLPTQNQQIKGKNRSCYCCGIAYREVHSFYHKLCGECAAFNFAQRNRTVDLTGRYCLVTGGRIKIGFQTVLKLLRDNATVMVTTRFAQDALSRFSKEPDFEQWQARLFIQPLDFRDLNGLLSFINYLTLAWPALDILINNAAQTVWHPPEFYALAMEQEQQRLTTALKDRIISPNHSAALQSQQNEENSNHLVEQKSLMEQQHLLNNLIPALDRHGQPIDSREQNSWNLRLHEVETRELLEVLLVNTTAPCLLTAKLKPLFLKSKFSQRFIINVTGLDGQFNRTNKTVEHPHVNMSKAALNMMTRTSASDYQQDGIYMNSVDTGWITHEGAFSKREYMRAQGFTPPLDEVDGAARIYHPIIEGIKGNLIAGQILRNYQPTDW